MTTGGYDAFVDPYCYTGTFVLKNKAGIRTEAKLQAFELEMTTLRSRLRLPSGDCDPAHYRAVHHHLFQDVYTWAGRYRTVRTAKEGNVFCYPEHIESQMQRLFLRLEGDAFKPGATLADFTEAAASFLGELNAIHPFREGNGRAQLSFLNLIAGRAGYTLDFNRIKPATFMRAMIASFHGNLEPLVAEIAALGR
jgi:cell filamentation protein